MPRDASNDVCQTGRKCLRWTIRYVYRISMGIEGFVYIIIFVFPSFQIMSNETMWNCIEIVWHILFTSASYSLMHKCSCCLSTSLVWMLGDTQTSADTMLTCYEFDQLNPGPYADIVLTENWLLNWSEISWHFEFLSCIFLILQLFHSLAHSLPHSPIHSLTHSPTHPPTHSHSLIHSLTHSSTENCSPPPFLPPSLTMVSLAHNQLTTHAL